jgi:hypothetical protein
LTDFLRLVGRRLQAQRRKASSGEKVNFNGSFAHSGRLDLVGFGMIIFDVVF